MVFFQVVLDVFDSVGSEVEHAGGEHGVGLAVVQRFQEVFGEPAPPLAMTGMVTLSDIWRIMSRS